MAQLYEQLKQSLECNKPTHETVVILQNEVNINAIDDHGNALLHYIAEENNIALIEIVIEKRRDLNIHIICNANKYTALIKSIECKNTEVSKILIDAGANVTLSDREQRTPLHHVVVHLDLEVATALLQHNANINAQDCNGKTPLYTLCYFNNYDNNDIRSGIMLDLLLSHGADVNIWDFDLKSPLNELAYSSEKAVNKLLNHTPRFDALDNGGYSTIFIFYQTFLSEDTILRVFEQGCDVKQTDPSGASVLHYAVVRDYKRVTYKLLSDGFDVNCREIAGNTALHFHTISMNNNEPLLYMLLYYGANPNLLNKNNNSSLLKAIRSGNHNLVNLLFLSYEGLNGDDCHKVVDAILENPLANSLDSPTVVAMLAKFENFFRNNKVEFKGFYRWKINYQYSYAILKHFLDLNAKIKCDRLIECMSSHFIGYYLKLIKLRVKDPCLKKDVLALVWFSLSLGITCDYLDFDGSSSIVQTLFDGELSALIWGGHSLYLLSKSFNCRHCPGFNKLFVIYYKLLHLDIGLMRGKKLLNKLILHKKHMLRSGSEDEDSQEESDGEAESLSESDSENTYECNFENDSEWETESNFDLVDKCESEYDDDFFFGVVEAEYESEYESVDIHKSEYSAQLSKILSFFTAEEYNRSTVMKAYSALGTTRSCYELPISVKSLVELSRDKARVFIMQKYQTKNFYQLHEVVNNLDIPNHVKRILKFRMPVNFKISQV